MPSFGNTFRTDSCKPDGRHGDVAWVMSGEGLAVRPGGAGEFTPIWWIQDAGDLFLGARLLSSIRDGDPATDSMEVELWSQSTASGAGILTKAFQVAPLATLPSGELRTLGVVGCPGRSWGIRARMKSATARQVMFQLTFFARFIGSGVLWLGEGVT